MPNPIDTMILSKETQALLRKVVEAQVKGCECGGSGEAQGNCPYDDHTLCGNNEGGVGDCYDPLFGDDDYKGCDGWISPCPTCADLRALAGELCCHDDEFKCSKCGASYDETTDIEDRTIYTILLCNPDLTTAMSGHELLIVSWMRRAGLWEGFEDQIIADEEVSILTNGLSLTQAIKSYLEERA